jgi:hypothetical protein
MATLNTSVTLKSASKIAGELTLDFTQLTDNTFSDASGDNLSVSTATEILSTSVVVDAYVYIKNTDSTHACKLRDVAGNMWGKVLAGEWAFFTIPSSTGLKLESASGTIVVNYLIFKK